MQAQQKEQEAASSQFLESSHQINIAKLQGVYRGLDSQALVRFVDVAYNQSFVIRVFQRKLQRYSKNGQLLGVLDFPNPNKLAYFTLMTSSKTLVSVCLSPLQDRKQQEIVEWNLESYEAKYTPFLRELKSILFTCFFMESKMVCIAEADTQYGKGNQLKIKRFKLIYLKFPESTLDGVFHPYHSTKFQVPKQKQESNIKMIKLNNNSMVGLIEDQLKQKYWDIIVYDMNESKPQWKVYRFIQDLCFDQKICSAKIVDVYEIQPCVLYIKIGVEPDKMKLGQRLLDDEPGLYQLEKQFQFFWDYKNGNVKRAPFALQTPHFIQFVGEYRPFNTWIKQKDYIQTARYKRRIKMKSKDAYDFKHCMEDWEYQKWERAQNNSRQMDILYVDLKSFEIIAKEKKTIQIARYYGTDPKWPKFYPVTCNPKMFLQFYEQKRQSKLFVKVRKVRELRFDANIIFAWLMTQIIENPEEDLLEQVCQNLLKGSQVDLNENEWKWQNSSAKISN